MGLFDFFSKEKKETLDKGLSKTKEGVLLPGSHKSMRIYWTIWKKY